MPTGHSLHIGINGYDTFPIYKDLNVNRLEGCEADIKIMHQIALDANFKDTNCNIIRSSDAYLNTIDEEFSRLADEAKTGDLVLITFSGHGCQKPDRGEDEFDGHDECLCLKDGLLFDDLLFEFFKRFNAGVRIVYIADCCNSETNHKMSDLNNIVFSFDEPARRVRGIFKDIQPQLVEYFEQDYQERLRKVREINSSKLLTAEMFKIAATSDMGKAFETSEGGYLTCAIKKIWESGNRGKNYQEFFQRVKEATRYPQIPKMAEPQVLNVPSYSAFYRNQSFLKI